MVMPPEQRIAQRTLVGLFRGGSGVRLTREDGLCVWRGRESEEWGLGASQLTKHLDALEIPYVVAIMKMKSGTGMKAGFDVRVPWNQLDKVTRWVPSFQKSIEAACSQDAS
ncbi:hypothetical protein E3T37_00730 [Cryobacterium sp. TMT2-10]|uniref:hypothetical protein n=1 Tax=Cryobacterium sp. TMT2-10 TaxID=1259244 RepID=UPI00106951DD|nr:hypothetical protein [Cryobacterium sp. TMT2-10]TFD43760.1 hypothetical protein E3T37_00730 [Cryobacterium sp. TMT2-10]